MNKAEQIKQVLIIGGKYRFKSQPDTCDLMHSGKDGDWNNFTVYGNSNGVDGLVWAQVLDEDLHMLEQVDTEPTAQDLSVNWPSCGIES